MLELPVDHGVAHDADAVGVGDHHRAVEKSGFLDPCGAGHLAIAIFGEPSGKDRIHGALPARENRRHARADRPNANLQFSFAGNQRAIADFDALHIGDGIERARRAFKWHAEIAGSLGAACAQRWQTQTASKSESDRATCVCISPLLSMLKWNRALAATCCKERLCFSRARLPESLPVPRRASNRPLRRLPSAPAIRDARRCSARRRANVSTTDGREFPPGCTSCVPPASVLRFTCAAAAAIQPRRSRWPGTRC